MQLVAVDDVAGALQLLKTTPTLALARMAIAIAADTNTWQPDAQVATIACLLEGGADPNVVDKNGATPLHRAVSTRSAPAVGALLDGSALPNARNKSGSTPLHLAVQTTGRGGSGSSHAREQQRLIIGLLQDHGADIDALDGRGKSAVDAASDSIRPLLSQSSG